MTDPVPQQPNSLLDDPGWLDGLADAVSRSGKAGLIQAFGGFRRALAARPQDPQAHYALGMAAKEVGRMELAAALIGRAVEQAPHRLEMVGDLGNVLSDMGRFEAATACYRRVLAAMPNHALAYNNLGETLQQGGDLEQAIACLRRAVEIRPDYADAWSNLGSTLEKDGRFKEAEAALNQALKISPNHVQARLNLGVVYHEEGMLERAIACFEQILARQPRSVQACNKLQKIYLEQGRFDRARALNAKLATIAPANQMAVCVEAFAALASGDLAGFRRLYGPDQLVHSQVLTPPDEHADLGAFNAALVEEVLAHPSLKWIHDSHDTTTRGFVYGLLERPGPQVASFARQLEHAIADYRSGLPDRPDHPFFARRSAETSLNLWATILDAGGWHPAHHHENHWLSGVYYAAAPSDAAENPESAPGWIEFNGFSQLPGLDAQRDEVRRYQPEAGRLLLFPAYLMHHTRPFHGSGRRVSLAFDLKPI